VLDYSKEFGHSDLIAFSERDLELHIASLRHRWDGHEVANNTHKDVSSTSHMIPAGALTRRAAGGLSLDQPRRRRCGRALDLDPKLDFDRYASPSLPERNPILLWEPSQNGLFFELPQRQSDITTVVSIAQALAKRRDA
jgi:hypothetical protein